MVRTFHNSIGDQNLLQKKIVRNPRYANVESRLDTGASLSRHQRRVDDIQENFKIRPNEIFKRVKLSALAELILQVAEQDRMNAADDAAPHPSAGILPGNKEPEYRPAIRTYSSHTGLGPRTYTQLSDVISGVGSRDIHTANDSGRGDSPSDAAPYKDCPYLLLDVQSEVNFEKCHVRGATQYDPTALNRTMNPYSKQLLQYINAENKIIVVYDDHEENGVATKVVTNLTERGINNAFLLSGGLKLIARRGLHSLVTGPYPRACFTEDIQKAASGFPRRTFKQPGPQQPEDPERLKFSEGELAQLRYQLDQYMQDTAASSYMPPRSARSTTSRTTISTIGGRSTTSSKAWR